MLANKLKAVQSHNRNKLHAQPHGLAQKILAGLTPTLFWLIKDLPCAACAQPAPLVNQKPQNPNEPNGLTPDDLTPNGLNPYASPPDASPPDGLNPNGLTPKIDKDAKQLVCPPDILLCPACAAALAPRLQGYCKFCALPFPCGSTGLGPCADCAQQKPAWQHIYFLAAYEGLLQKLLLNLKFQNGLYVARILGKFLARRIQDMQALEEHAEQKTLASAFALLDNSIANSVDNSVASSVAGNSSGNLIGNPIDNLGSNSKNFSCVIPVPLSAQRLKERGYNQSLEIARVVAKELGLPLEHQHLLRIKHGIPQEQLSRKERFKAVQGMFAVSAPQNISNRNILLLDDIMTTGATIQECTRILLAAGANTVSVAVVARTGLE